MKRKLTGVDANSIRAERRGVPRRVPIVLGDSRPKKAGPKKGSEQHQPRPQARESPAGPTGPIVIHTDGGCWPNPGVGGWGAVVALPGGRIVELSGGEMRSTNNRMERMAPIVALESLGPGAGVDRPLVFPVDADDLPSPLRRVRAIPPATVEAAAELSPLGVGRQITPQPVGEQYGLKRRGPPDTTRV
jgi:hypothetical protein